MKLPRAIPFSEVKVETFNGQIETRISPALHLVCKMCNGTRWRFHVFKEPFRRPRIMRRCAGREGAGAWCNHTKGRWLTKAQLDEIHQQEFEEEQRYREEHPYYDY